MRFDPPLQPDAAQARRLLRAELADPAYHRDEASGVSRALSWFGRRVIDLLDQVSQTSASGWALVLVATALLVGVVLAVRFAPARRARRGREPLFTDTARSADEMRRAADLAAASGDWDTAVRERLRAVIRDLEERGLLDERPGRTADEAAAEASQQLPGCAGALTDGARVFDEVCYGRRPARPADEAALRRLDEQVRSARVLERR